MPYISQDRREEISSLNGYPKNAGELNYAITMMCHDYLRRQGLRYQYINDVIGALEGAKLELYRRVVADYEDTKIIENGDITLENTK